MTDDTMNPAEGADCQTLRMPDNSIMRYVCGFAFNIERTRVLLIQKMKPTWQKGRLNGVGGKIEGDETPIAAMKRECFEEVGCQFDWEPTIRLYNTHFEVFFFKAFAQKHRIEILDWKDSEHGETLHVLDVKQAFHHRWLPNLKWLITLSVDREMLGEHGDKLEMF